MRPALASLLIVLCACEAPPPTRDRTPQPAPGPAPKATPTPAPQATAVVIPPLPAPAPAPAFEDFLGAEACAECHREKYTAWLGSTHGKAGGEPGPEVVVSNFSGVLKFADATVTLAVEGGRYRFHVDRPDQPRQTLEVAAMVGGGHMLGGGTQTAFTRFPDGSLRLIPFDYSKTDDVWFCEASGGRGWVPITPALKLTDCAYWPPRSNFGPICGNCHASQTVEGYDPQTRRETLHFKDLRINCESCHGPGRRHVELARQPGFAERADIGLEPLALLDTDASNGVCFRCHAVTQPLAPGYLPGARFEAHYALNFQLRSKHKADGRVDGFGYQEGHLWSDCYLNGSMTCVDCHAPHTGGYRDRQGFALKGKLADGQCLGCHPSKAADVAAHTHHPADSPGSRCVSCHMPFLQHLDLGTAVRFTRSDHVISIPRPAHDVRQGLKTACAAAGCHAGQTPEWMAGKTRALWGPLKPLPAIVGDLHTLRTSDDQKALAAAFLAERPHHPGAELERLRAALERLNYMSEAVIARVEALAAHPDLDVRALALSYLHEAAPHLPRLAGVVSAALGQLGDDAIPVRRRWALWMLLRARKYKGNGRLRQALATLEEAVKIDPTSGAAKTELARAYASAGQHADALSAFIDALALGPRTRREHDELLAGLCRLPGREARPEAVDACRGWAP